MSFTERTNLFVVGRPRSGTSLIVRLLDGHSDFLTVSSETLFYHQWKAVREIQDPQQQFLHLVGRPFDFETGRPLEFSMNIEEDSNWQRSGFYESLLQHHPIPDECVRKLRQVAALGPKAALKCLFTLSEETYSSSGPRRFVVEKTPENERHIERIRADFPRSIFLHMIRDPFDVVASRSRSKKEREFVHEVLAWRRSIEIFRYYKSALPNSHFAIRFEDLLGEPERVMRRLCAALQVEFHQSMLHPTQHNGREKWASNSRRTVRPEDGQIDASVSFRNLEAELSSETLDAVGAWVGRAYVACGFSRNRGRLRYLPSLRTSPWGPIRTSQLYIRKILLNDLRFFSRGLEVL